MEDCTMNKAWFKAYRKLERRLVKEPICYVLKNGIKVTSKTGKTDVELFKIAHPEFCIPKKYRHNAKDRSYFVYYYLGNYEYCLDIWDSFIQYRKRGEEEWSKGVYFIESCDTGINWRYDFV